MSPDMMILAAIIAYFLVMIGVGIFQGRKEDHEGFVIGARNVGVIPTTGSLAASFRDGAGIVLWVGMAYTMGYGALWVIYGALSGLAGYMLFAPHLRGIAKERGYVTVGEMISDSIGDGTRRLASLSGVALIFMTVALIWLGYAAKEILGEGMEASEVTFALFAQNALPTWILGYLAVSMMAMTMSTLDTQSYLFSATLMRDFAPSDWSKSRDRYIKMSRIILLVAMIVATSMAMTIGDVVKTLFDSVALLFVLVPVFIYAAVRKQAGNSTLDRIVFLSLMAGIATYAALFYNGVMEDMLFYYVPVAVTFVGVVVGIKVSSKNNPSEGK